jgi:chromosome segregation ATPase
VVPRARPVPFAAAPTSRSSPRTSRARKRPWVRHRPRWRGTRSRLDALEREAEETAARVTATQNAERVAAGARDDAARKHAALKRECDDSDLQLSRIQERIGQAETRLGEVDQALTDGELARARTDETLGAGRGRLTALEAEQEHAREAKLHWQVQEAHLGARLRTAGERLERALLTIGEAGSAGQALSEEVLRLEQETQNLTIERTRADEQRTARAMSLQALELAAAEAEAASRRPIRPWVARSASSPIFAPPAS